MVDAASGFACVVANGVGSLVVVIVSVDNEVYAILVKDGLPHPALGGDAPCGMAAEEWVVEKHDGPFLILAGFQVFDEPFGLRFSGLKWGIPSVAVEGDDVGVGIVEGIIDFIRLVGQ